MYWSSFVQPAGGMGWVDLIFCCPHPRLAVPLECQGPRLVSAVQSLEEGQDS